MASPRVLHLLKGLGAGGAERLVAATTAAGGGDFAYEVAYLLPWKVALVPELTAAGVPTHCLEVRREADVRWARRLRTLVRERGIDIVHAHSPYPAAIARLAVRSLPAAS